jgi:hypothetical protein
MTMTGPTSFGRKLQLGDQEELTVIHRAELRTVEGVVLKTWIAETGRVDIPPFEEFLSPRFRGRIVAVGERRGEPAEQVVLEWLGSVRHGC